MVTTTTFEVPWFASDGESGVQGVELWYRKDGGTWIKYGSNFTASPITFQSSTTGGDGFYEFYTVATDNAGNKESAPTADFSGTAVVTSFVGSRIYVDWDANGSRSGTSWANACRELGLAFILVDTFGVGEIWVAGGTYKDAITLRSGVKVYGGFAGTETALADRNVAANQTTIDVSTADEESPANHGVVMDSVISVVLDGFTITGGNADGPLEEGNGGGIYCNNLDDTNTIANCNITGNEAERGGGLYCLQSSPAITNCNISNNTAEIHGGGIGCNDNSSPTISNCMISGNTTQQSGGAGILCYANSSPTITRCIIKENRATVYDGGGIHCSLSSSPTITNCVIAGNEAGNEVVLRYGGGICCRIGSSPTVINCTITHNTAGFSGGGIGSFDGVSPEITNCILWANVPDQIAGTTTVTYSDIQAGYAGTGNIDLHPLFTGDGYHLLENSPCIDAGTPDGAPDRDIDGHFRPEGAGYDMGADEFAYDNDYDGVPDQEEYGPDGTDPTYDGNNDGIPDAEQGNVTSLHTYDRRDYVTLACPDPTTMRDVEAVDNPSSDDAPSEAEFPYGFFGFGVNDVDPGGSTTVTLYLPAEPESYYKYGPTPDNPANHWYEFLYDGETGAEINGNLVTLYFVDGERGDDNPTPDGKIIDQGAPAIITAAEPTPTPAPAAPAGGGGGGGGCFIGTATEYLGW
jgi:parallel beta-helix repeat protein